MKDKNPKTEVIERCKIICPNCLSLQDAEITYTEGDPWPIYIHDCTNCGYTIMESEWDRE